MTTVDTPRTVPFNDLSRSAPALWAEVQPALAATVKAGMVVLGKGVAEFEDKFADYLGGGHVIGVASGTDALELALRGTGIRRGMRVGLAANAGFYATCALLAIGAEPIYVDVADGEISPGPAEVMDCITADGVRAFVITHLYGRVARDIRAIAQVCRAHDIVLVEDCSQSHGSRDGATATGAFGDAAAFSFYPTKNLGALGDGGAVFCRDERIAQEVRSLRQYGWASKYEVSRAGGMNSRLDELQAVILTASLRDLDARNEKRRCIVDAYRAAVPELPLVCVAPDRPAWVAHLCVAISDDRDADRATLHARGVATDVHFPIPDHRQPVWTGSPFPSLPRTELLARRVLSLPCFPEMSTDEVEHVAAALATVFGD